MYLKYKVGSISEFITYSYVIIICHELFVYYVDLKTVLEAGTYKLAAEWEQLYLALGIEEYKLKQISAEKNGETRPYLNATSQTWIDTGSANLEELVKAVANPAFVDKKKK